VEVSAFDGLVLWFRWIDRRRNRGVALKSKLGVAQKWSSTNLTIIYSPSTGSLLLLSNFIEVKPLQKGIITTLAKNNDTSSV
jgi:hypothetical protein